MADVRSTITTVTDATELVKELAPTLQTMSVQYTKAAPLLDWVIDYWPVAAAVTFLAIMSGSAVGSIIPSYAKKKRRSR